MIIIMQKSWSHIKMVDDFVNKSHRVNKHGHNFIVYWHIGFKYLKKVYVKLNKKKHIILITK